MQISSIQGNGQKLDGGAMFGNAPKALWSRWASVDEHNRIDLACRALLLETDHHKVLFEAGIGVFMPPKLKDRFGVFESRHVLLDSLSKLDIAHVDITDIVVSHLHFDHVGGLLAPWQETMSPKLLFPNAVFHVGKGCLERARHPHLRDRASFIPELPNLLAQSGRLNQIDGQSILKFDACKVGFFESHGHTPSMMCADISGPVGRVIFAADLIPGTPWVHLPITMGYDRFPETLIDEKKRLLQSAMTDDASLFFTHDPVFSMAKIALDEEKNRFSAVNKIDHATRLDLLG